MQGFRAGQEGDEDLQGTQDTRSLPQEIQAKGLLFLENWSVTHHLLSLVDLPIEGFDLTEHVANPDLPAEYFNPHSMDIEGKRVIYDLIGISNHFGSTGGGHYTAYCKYL